jgi:CubicO group peptidase (beta-lactamase class C family)
MKTPRSIGAAASVAACALAACGSTARSPARATTRVDTAALDAYVDRELAPHSPAVMVGLLVDGELVWRRGAGSRDGSPGGAPPDRRAMFRIGSITKVFTAIAIMRLAARGVLDLDTPVAKHVPELAARLPGVTLRHLVTHTSGIPSVGDGSAPYWTQRPPTEAEMLRALDTPTEFPPGARHAYSNAGMALAGLVAARAAGRPYRELMAAEVFAPLGVQPLWDREAVPAERRVAGRDGDRVDPPTWALGAFEAAGGLWASLDDLVALARFATGRAEGAAPLDPAARRLMSTDDPLPGPNGVSWLVVDEGFGHSGSTTDFSASVVASHDGKAAAIVLASGGAMELVDCAAAAIARAALRGGAPRSCARAAPRDVGDAATTAALDRLVAFLAAPTEAAAGETFAPAFLAAIPPPTLVATSKQIAAGAGRCTGHTVRARGEALLECPRGKLRVTFILESAPPHRFEMLQAHGIE